jgi:ribonuclease P protein component
MATRIKVFGLGKTDRLKGRKAIDALFSSGRRMPVFPYLVFYQFRKPATGTNPLQCGFGAGTRHFKKAVDRNRIKRLTREAWRVLKPELATVLQTGQKEMELFVIYTGKTLPDTALVQEKVSGIIKKLIMLVHENSAADT